MSIDDLDTDRNAGESGGGLISGWLSRIKPDSRSSDPLKFAKWGGWVVAVYLLVTTVVGIYWSSTPDHFDVRRERTSKPQMPVIRSHQ